MPDPDVPCTTLSDPDVEPLVVPVVEERLDVHVVDRVTARVRVSTHTETIERNVEEMLSSTTAEIVRVPIGRELAAGEPMPGPRVEDDVTIVPVFEERLVVEKRLVLVEEIHIERRSETEAVTIPVSLRRQRVDVERLPAGDPEPSPSEEYDP